MMTANSRGDVRYLYIVTFATVVLFAIVLRIIFSTGFYLSADDYYYSKAAHEISAGQFNLPKNHWDARIGNTITIAFSYLLFGVGPYTATFASIFFTILNVLIIYLLSKELFARDNYRLIAVLASIFFVFLPISIAEGSSLSMHQGVTFFMSLSFYFMLVGERVKTSLWYALSGLSIGVAYLFHETGAYALIVIALFYLYKRKIEWRALLILALFLLTVGIEAVSYYELTGKMFYRQTISLAPLEARQETRVGTLSGFVDKFRNLETIDNPLKGTFWGDSWVFEPFRWLFLDPAHSIFYHIMLIVSIMLLLRGDKNIALLFLLFSGLFLYYVYGSPNPLSYEPLRRLPRYILPCAIIGAIICGYGMQKLLKRPTALASVIAIYIAVSILAISVKGGEVGQRMFQAKNFYDYISEHPGSTYLTDRNTFNGIEFLGRYENDFKIMALDSRELATGIRNADLPLDKGLLLINIPEDYQGGLRGLEGGRFRLIQRIDRKPRKICYLPAVQQRFADTLCNVSNGGRIYEILPPA